MQRRDEKKNKFEIYIIGGSECKYTYTTKLLFDTAVDMMTNRPDKYFSKCSFSYELPNYSFSCYCTITEFHTKLIIDAVEQVFKILLEIEPRISVLFIVSDLEDDKYRQQRFITPDK